MATPSAADLQAQAKLMDELIAKQKELNKLQGKSEGTAKKVTQQYKVEYETLKDTSEILKRMGKSGFTVEKIINYSKAVKSVQADLNKVSNEIDKLGEVDPYNEVEYRNYLKALEKQEKAQKRLNDLNEAASHQINYKEQANGIKKTGSALHRTRGAVGNFRDEMKNAFSGRDIEGAGNRLSEYGKQWTGVGSAMSKMKGITGVAGKAMKSLGGLSGGIGTKLAGPAGAIYGIVKQVWDYGMSVDQFVKDVNKQFVSIRGPDIMTADVKKQFKEFNNSLYRTVDNIRAGLNAEQIRGFLNSIIQAGVHLDRLNTGFESYRNAVYIAAKASATLGIELPTVGNMMGKMMVDMRMNVDQIDKTFIQTAFDAKKAGLSTDRFFSAVENASASLAFYGVFIDKASRNMAHFVNSSVQGADEAAKTVTDLTQAFKGMSLEQRSAFTAFVGQSAEGSKVMKESFQTLQDQAKKRIENIEFNISAKKRSGGSTEDIAKMMAERNRLAEQSIRYDRALTDISKGNYVALSQYLPMISGDTLKLMKPLIKNTLGTKSISDATDEQIIVLNKILEQNGFPPEMADKLVAETRAQRTSVEADIRMGTQNFSKLQKSFQFQGEESLKAAEYLKNIDNEKDNTDEIAKNTSQLMGILDKADVDQNLRNLVRKMLLIDRTGKATGLVRKLLKGDFKNADDLKNELGSIADTNEFVESAVYNAADIQEEGKDDLAEKAKKTFDEIKDQTMSYNEMVKIAKDEVEWRLKSLGIFQALNTGVFKILKWMIKGDNPYMDAEKAASKKILESLGISEKEATSSGTYLLQALKYMEETSKKTVAQEDLQSIYQKAMEDPTKAAEILDQERVKIEEKRRDAEKKGDKKNIEIYDQMLTSLKDTSEKLGQDPDVLQKSLDESKTTSDLLKSQNQRATEAVDAIYKLKDLTPEGRDQESEDLAKKIAMGTKESFYDAGKSISESLGKGGDLAKIMEKTGATYDDVEKSLMTYRTGGTGPKSLNERERSSLQTAYIKRDNDQELIERRRKEGLDKNYSPYEMGKYIGEEAVPKANLRTPEMITSPGVVKLDPGEIILPDQRRAPLIGSSPTGGAQTMGGGGSKNITINVSATETNLAAKIANEIRAVLYQERLTGMA